MYWCLEALLFYMKKVVIVIFFIFLIEYASVKLYQKYFMSKPVPFFSTSLADVMKYIIWL